MAVPAGPDSGGTLAAPAAVLGAVAELCLEGVLAEEGGRCVFSAAVSDTDEKLAVATAGHGLVDEVCKGVFLMLLADGPMQPQDLFQMENLQFQPQ